MLLVLLIILPILLGAFTFTTKKEGVAKNVGLFSSGISLVLAGILASQYLQGSLSDFSVSWMPSLGAKFALSASGMSVLMVLLTSLVFLLIFISQKDKELSNEYRFYGLMQWAQAGLIGVFLANDLLLFYFFWELALIPVYFLCSMWGGDRRIKVTFKFFIYTFLGSLFLLGGIIFLYTLNPNKSFDLDSIIQTGNALDASTQQVLFWVMFVAFAIKMPIFPFHTWQPDTYEQSATPTTIVLSALMVKMGLFATVKWITPVLPEGVALWADVVIILSLVGLIYASLLATIQSDIKRLIAYSSIAHIALMCVGIFAGTSIAMNGLIVQMFNHGVNIAGLWLIVDMIEKRYGTRNLKELGGLANNAPKLTIALVIIAFANISLPLTNAFIGEFMLFHGIFESTNPHHIIYMAIAGLGVILGAVYTLNMVQKVAYGDKETAGITDVTTSEWLVLLVVIILILAVGVYPNLIYQFLPA